MAMKMHLEVTYDDGSTVKVDPGQREMAEWEAQPFGCSALSALDVKAVTYLRFVAWACLKRTEGLKDPFPRWGRDVESVEFRDEEADGRLDPTTPDRPEGA